jgi:hypothetical protein
MKVRKIKINLQARLSSQAFRLYLLRAPELQNPGHRHICFLQKPWLSLSKISADKETALIPPPKGKK